MDFAVVLDEAREPEVMGIPEPQNPLELAPIKRRLAKYDLEIDGMVADAQALEVKDEVSNVRAVELAGDIKKLNKAIEALRTDFKKPALDYGRAVDNLAKHYQDRLNTSERVLKQKAGQYQAKVELERRKAQEEVRKAAEEAQKRIDSEAKAAGVESVKIETPIVPEAPKATRTEKGTMTFKEVWKFKVSNPQEVPRDYLMVDESAIRKAVQAGMRNIPGVEIYSEKEAVLRT